MNTKKNIKIIFSMLLLATLGNTNSLYAQQDAQYTHYMYNTVDVNPAYAGSRDTFTLFGLYRTQWVGLEGAPKTATLAFNTPVSDRVGLGMSVVNDKIGPCDESTFSADLSYNIPVTDTYRLFFGMKATANLLNVDYSKLAIYNPTDPLFQNNVDNKFSPNIGAGLYLHSDKGYLGVSIPNFLETTHYKQSSMSTAKEKMHYYFIGGYVFDLSDSIKFKPAVLTKIVNGAPLQLDLSANFLMYEKLTLGLAYRWDAAVSAMAGFQISPSLLMGYSYDMDTTKLGNYNSGSHEIFLRYELFKKHDKVITPRFF